MKPLRCVVCCIIAMAVSHLALARVLLFEGFNQGGVPAGWSVSNDFPLSFVTSSTWPDASPYEGTHFVKFNSHVLSIGTRSFLTSPAISTIDKSNIKVVFAWHRDTWFPTAVDCVNVQYSTDGTNWNDVAAYPRTNTVTSWEMKTCALPTGAANQPTLYVGFLFYSACGNNCYLDAVRIEGTEPGEADPPTAFMATAASAVQIDLQWQTNAAGNAVMIASNTTATIGTPSNGVAYSVGATLPGGGGVVYQGTGLTLPLSGLQPGTRYYFKAWSVGTVTQYSDGVTADALTDHTLPIVEGFNSRVVPDGWSISNTAQLLLVTSSTSPAANPYEGTHFVKFACRGWSGRALLTSPRFSSQGGLVAIFVDFAWHQDPGYPTALDRMTVEWSSNGTHWVAAQTFTRPAPVTGWTQQRVWLPAAALGHPHLQVRFHFVSASGNNCYLDAVRIVGATPNVYLVPDQLRNVGAPGKSVVYPLNILNLTGGDRDVQLTYLSPWPANGSAATGVIPDNGATDLTVEVQTPVSAIDGQSCTTTVHAITADNQFTNTAVLITTCRWAVQLVCETFFDSLGGWANYFAGGVNAGWYHHAGSRMAAHDQLPGGTNWLVSPAIDLNHVWADYVTLSFWFYLTKDLIYPEGVYLVTGNRDPSLGSLSHLANLQSRPGYSFGAVDLTPYITNAPVYLAFGYVSTNPFQMLDDICITAEKKGVENALLLGPAALPLMTSYGTAVAITGGLHAAGESGAGGPAPLTTAQVGFGPQGTPPDNTNWTWYSAVYLGAGGPGGTYDIYTATPQITIAGRLNYCYRFRRGTAAWVYGDLDGSSNGFDPDKVGQVDVAMLPPQGALLRNQTITISSTWVVTASSFRDQTQSPPVYWELADDLTLPYDAYIRSVRMGGTYWAAGRQNLEQGFWLRIYANAVNKPGTLRYEHFEPGYACEELIGRRSGIRPYYKYHIDVHTQLLVRAGETIWISLQHEVQNNTDWSLLITPDGVRGTCAQQTGMPTAWNGLGYDLGMEIYGIATNVGAISGSVRDAKSMAPIAGARVVITNAVYSNAVLTDTNGFYITVAPTGTYEMAVTKANYLPTTAHGVVVTANSTTTADFYLEGSYLRVTPTNVTRAMALGQETVNPLVLSNSGPLVVQYALTLGNSRVVTTGTKRITHVSLPPCDGKFPRGPAPLSTGRAPKASASSMAAIPATLAPLSSAVKAYGFNVYGTSSNALISLMTDNPSGYTTIGTVNTGAGGFVCGAAFLNGDFSKLYCLLYADNKLVTVNTLNAAVMDSTACVPPAGEDWTGLAAAPDGRLYASTYGAVSKLYTLDPATGACTLVGEITGASVIIGIAVNAAGEMYGLDIANDVLVRINRATGAGTVIGSIGFDANYAQDLAFDLENNVLYLAAYNNFTGLGELRIADTTTGNTALVGQFSATPMQVDGFETMTSNRAWARVTPMAGAVAARSTETVNVTFDASVVSNLGEYTAELVLEGTFVNQPAPVPLKMIIASGPIISAPSTLDFGVVAVGDSSNLPLHISNIGIGVLSGEISAVTAPFSIVGANSYMIPSEATSVHTLAFTPTAEAPYTNIIVLTGGGGTTVTLTGTGVPEPVLWLTAVLLGMCVMLRQ